MAFIVTNNKPMSNVVVNFFNEILIIFLCDLPVAEKLYISYCVVYFNKEKIKQNIN